MATNYDINNSGRETNVMFGGISNNYTFVTTEGVLVDLGALNSNSSSASTTLLKVARTSEKILPLNSAIILPPKDKTLSTSWAKVGAKDNYMANMTVGAMTNNTKSFMVTSYSEEAICISNQGKKSYQSCAAFDLGINSNSWRPQVGWDTPPTVYTKAMGNSNTINKNSQILFPKTPSPRWFRTAGIQKVKSEEYGDRLFFIYIDLLSTFYIYPVKNPIPYKDEDGKEIDPKIISQYLTTSKYCINDGKYKTYEVDWDRSKKPDLKYFHGFKELKIATLPYPYKGDKKYLYFDNDFSNTEDSNNDKDFNKWMGEDSAKFKHSESISTTQYVWTFNYNATKAVTIAFEEGENIQGQTLNFAVNGIREPLYKILGTPLIITKAYADKLGDTSSINKAPKLKEAKTIELKKYYPSMIEVSIEIVINSKELTDYTVKGKTESKYSKDTKVYYIGAGYTHPILDNKYKIKSGNELVHLAISCYGDTSNYSIDKNNPEKNECPHDIIFKTLKDDNAERDLSFKFLGKTNDGKDNPDAEIVKDSKANLAFLKMLISGDYNMETIKNLIDRVVITKGNPKPKTMVELLVSEFTALVKSRYRTNTAKAIFYSIDTPISVGGKYPPVKSLDIINNSKAEDLRLCLAYILKVYSHEMYTSDHSNSYRASLSPPINDWSGIIKDGTATKSETQKLYSGYSYPSTVFTSKGEAYGFDNMAISAFSPIYYFIEFCTYILYFVGCPYYNYKDFLLISRINLVPINKLLKEYLEKSDGLVPYLFYNMTLISLLTQWYLINEIIKGLIKDTQITSSVGDIMLSVLAQSFFLDKKDIEFKYIEDFVKKFFLRLPVLPAQVIDNILVSNMVCTIADSPSSNSNTPSDAVVGECSPNNNRNIRKYPMSILPEVKRDMLIMQLQASSSFGKKISNFSAILEFRKDKDVLSEYLLLKSPYIALNAISKFISTLPLIPFCKGDELPYNSRIYLSDDDPKATPTEYEILRDLGYNKKLQANLWNVSSSKESLMRYHKQATIFGLYVNPTKDTISNNLIAVDFSSCSLMLYSTKANYSFTTDYGIGNALYINHKLQLANGRCIDTPPLLPNKDLEVMKGSVYVQPKLDIDLFNLIYSKIAVTQTIDDIAKTNSLYKDGKIPKWVTNATYFYTDTEYDYQDDYNLSSLEGNNVTSVLNSHLNGSIAAYSIPPYGFLKELNNPDTNSKLKGNYTAKFTIDYLVVKYFSPIATKEETKPPIAKQENKDSKKPVFLITTHKESFNNAFTQKRDYDYYIDQKKPGFMGGFCTASVFYDFRLPNEYVKLAENYEAPKKT